MTKRHRNILIAAAAAIVVVGGILAGVLAGGGPTSRTASSGSPSPATSAAPTSTSTTVAPSTTSTPPTTPAPSTTATPSTTAAPPTTVPSGPPGGPVPANFAPVSVTFVSPEMGWVLGTSPCPHPVCTSIARTTDGGAHWASIPAPNAPLASGGGIGGNGVGQVVFADPLDGWTYGPGLWSTHDGGATWHQLPLPAGATAVTGMAAAGGAIFAVTATNDGAGPPSLLRSPIRTDSFSVVGSAPAGTQPLLAAAGNTAWALGAGSFQEIPASGPVTSLRSPCPPNPGGGVIGAWSNTALVVTCAEGGALGSMTKQVFVSGDGGNTFASTAPPPLPGDLEGVATNGATLVVTVSSGASDIYASFDGGHSWATPYDDASGGAPFSDVGFTSTTQGVAIEGVAGTGAQPFLLMTRDGGHTWNKVPIAG